MVYNHDCRKLIKIKCLFTFPFVLPPIFAAVVLKINPEVLTCTDVRAACVIFLLANHEGHVESYRNALSVLANLIKVGIL